ncbi:protein kinase G-activating protein GlnX [Kitasatospora arboriphila]|uniref:Protein kinase G-activating protein GlnX n=1 Tax=Kitasatospora arboriphila TaxID=258052 RepID=A0ABN1TDS8_9ACTN
MAPGALDTTTGTKGTGSPAMAGPGAAAGPPGSRAPLAVASATRRRVGRSSWTTPRLVRALTAACLVCVLGLGGAVASVLAGARDGIDAIGHRAAPQAVRAADLYFALSDMDAQAANLLLIGADPDYLALRRQTLDIYEQRRTEAGEDLQRAAEAAVGDPAGQRAVQIVIGELGRYEALVARTQLLEDQAQAPAGRPSAQALETYRQATDLLRQRLLPAADQVTAANATTVDRVYTEQRDDLAAGWWWILAAGLLALVALGALQRTLAVRFRRLVNPLLAAVTLLTAVALLTGLHLTGQADRHLVVAKSNAYDSVLALSRARATAYDMNADESRYLTDPARAAAYEQSFLDKTQAFARLDGAALDDYDRRLDAAARAHRTDHSDIPFGGYLGDELRNITFAGEQGASERVLETFRQYQLDDRRMRALRVQGRLKEAVTFNTGLAAGQSNADFAELGEALDAVLAVNRQAMDRAVAQADGELDGPAAAGGTALLAVLLALTVLGVRPRLREYR